MRRSTLIAAAGFYAALGMSRVHAQPAEAPPAVEHALEHNEAPTDEVPRPTAEGHEAAKAAPTEAPAHGEGAAPAAEAAAPAHAEPAPHEGTEPAHAEPHHAAAEHGTAGEHAEGAHHAEHEEEEGIVNWWSWDYGPSPKDPSHKDWPAPFGWALVNFGVFLFILSRILWKPMKAGFVQRHEKIKGELDEASRLHKAAEAQLAEFQKKVSHVDQEVDALLAQLRKEAEADRARIIAAAEAEAKRLKLEADRQIAVEIERARAELRKETVEAALKAAEEMLRSQITSDDQKQLAQRYLASVEQLRAAKGGAA